MYINYNIKSIYNISNWSGGTTKELYISPENEKYNDRNFDFRISSATVDLEESDFTPLEGFMRHIMVLDGEMKLIHENEYQTILNVYDKDYFNGKWKTKSFGKCTDYNLMLKDGLVGDINPITQNSLIKLNDLKKTNYKIDFFGFYILNNCTLNILLDKEKILELTLSKEDFIIFKNLDDIDENLFFSFLGELKNVICISNIVYKK